ncbi:MAG: sortase [Clostridia bacterium]|nr:sortase [Clostridia bacterium]
MRKTGIAFMVTGAVCIVSALALLLYNNAESKKAHDASSELIESLRTVIAENEDIPVDPFDDEMTVREIDGYGYIGYLTVPALELELPVMSEWDYTRLKLAPCRYFGSTKTDNLVIAAHNYKYHFGYLGHLTEGDIVIFTDMDSKVYNYRVNSVELLEATDVDKVKNTGDDLILYTCNYSGSMRVTVRCSYIK